MTTEKQDPTAEDVERDATDVCRAMMSWACSESSEYKKAWHRLKAMAMLGVQVSGLVAGIAALQRDLQATHDAARHERDRADANDRNAYAKASQLGEATREVSALQARVAELERERNEARRLHGKHILDGSKAISNLETERDALRAQVEATRTRVEKSTKYEVRPEVRSELLAALSTPPAEKKRPVPGDGQKPHLPDDVCHANRDGDCGWTKCPQVREGEPSRSGRHCPIDTTSDDE